MWTEKFEFGIASLENVRTFSGHSDAIQSLGVSSDKNFLVSSSLDGTVPR